MSIKSYIPNTITCCNLLSGCVATVYAFHGNPFWALLWIMIGAAFDFCDGLSARALGVSSPIGKELDSLADDITFGVAPATIVYSHLKLSVLSMSTCLGSLATLIPYLAFIIAAFSALRLAKFNLDTRQTTSFIGLPTPANALFWGSLIVGYGEYFEGSAYGVAAILALVLLSSYLLVSELPMFALKFKHWGITEDDNVVKYGFIAFSAAAFITSLVFGMALSSIAIIILAYILISFIMWCTGKH